MDTTQQQEPCCKKQIESNASNANKLANMYTTPPSRFLPIDLHSSQEQLHDMRDSTSKVIPTPITFSENKFMMKRLLYFHAWHMLQESCSYFLSRGSYRGSLILHAMPTKAGFRFQKKKKLVSASFQRCKHSKHQWLRDQSLFKCSRTIKGTRLVFITQKKPSFLSEMRTVLFCLCNHHM